LGPEMRLDRTAKTATGYLYHAPPKAVRRFFAANYSLNIK
jgi:hypothetical protein